MSNFTKQFYQIIEKTEDKAFTKPAFELFEKKSKIKSKLKYCGGSEGIGIYRAEVKLQPELKSVFSKMFVEARVDEMSQTALFVMRWVLTGMAEDEAEIARIESQDGKLKYIAYDDREYSQPEAAIELPTGIAIKLD